MSNIQHCFKHNNSSVTVISELVGFTVIIIILTSALTAITTYSRSSSKNIENDELFHEAVEILSHLRNHKEIIYQEQPGVLDMIKVIEFADNSIEDLIRMPISYGIVVHIDDLSDTEPPFELFQEQDRKKEQISDFNELVTVDSPVNLQVTPVEIHSGKLIVNVWR